MYEEQENCTLTCDGEEVAMKSVHVHGKLDGLLLRMKLRQTYTNESEDTLETVYTFPLAWGCNPPQPGRRTQRQTLKRLGH